MVVRETAWRPSFSLVDVELERVSFIKVNFEINDKNSSLVTDKAAY